MPSPRILLALAVTVTANAATAQGPIFGQRGEVAAHWCGECHDADSKKGGLDLGAAPADELARLVLLARSRDRIAAGEMPPRAAERPDAAAREELLAFCDRELAVGVPKLPHTAGGVTIRRLSRGQWEHTIADLFGVRAAASAGFPADDLAYGFDSIGAALSFSTLHLEQYLAAATEVAAQVFPVASSGPMRRQAERMRLESGPGANQDGEVAVLYTNATLATDVAVPRDGVYRLRVAVAGDLAGDQPPRLQLLLDERRLETIDVDHRDLRTVQVTVPLVAGERHFALAFANDYWQPNEPDPARRDRNLRVDWFEVEGPIDVPEPSPQRRWLAMPGDRDAEARLRLLADRIATRAFRGLDTPTDRKRLLAVATAALSAGADWNGAARDLLTAALVSPRFLFRIERPVAAANGTAALARLPGRELAVRLAYFVWSSAPDDRLRELGADGSLSRPDVFAAELQRLLADPRADRLATEFAAQWLELRALDVRTPDPQRFPGFDDELRRAFATESELLFLAVMRGGADVRELVDCDYTHANARLAAFYGLPGTFDAVFRRVTLPAALRERGGLLGHAAMHAITANPTRTSPVKRGKWILENLLGQAPPQPPPGNDRFADEGAAAATPRGLRAQLQAHRERAACASCHERMDEFGYLLERYDAVGRHRERDDGGEPIDCTADLPDGRRLDGLRALQLAIADDPALPRTLASKLFVFAVGREPSPTDRLRLRLEVDRLRARGVVTIADLVALVAASDAFGTTTVEAR